MRHAVLLVLITAFAAVAVPFAAAKAADMTRETIPAAENIAINQEEQSVHPQVEKTETPAPVEQVVAGEFLIYDRSTDEVMTLSVDEYIRGAVASEMPASFHQQALNAQAVAAHSWAVYSGELQRISPDESLKGADFSVDSEKCEGYMTKERFFERYGSNASMLWPKICAAADYAVGKIVTFEGETALTAYHSASAGETEGAENVWGTSLPYLVPVESEGDTLSPYYEVTEKYDQKTMKLLLMQQFPDAQLSDDYPQGWIEILETSPSGYVTLAEVGGVEAHGQQVRTALSLRSSCFEIDYNSGTFSILTRGYGHGVGMSQYGADYMARQGSSAEEILAHYYPGTELMAVSR